MIFHVFGLTFGNLCFDEFILHRGFQRDEVHAPLPAEIPSVQPVSFAVVGRISPRKPVALIAEYFVDLTWCCCFKIRS